MKLNSVEQVKNTVIIKFSNGCIQAKSGNPADKCRPKCRFFYITKFK